MQQLVYALNDIKRDLNVITQKLAAVDRVIKTGDISVLSQPIQGGQRQSSRKSNVPGQNAQFGQSYGGPQVFGQPSGGLQSLWGASSGTAGGGRRRNRKRNRNRTQGFGQQAFGQQAFGGQIPPHLAQQAHLTAQYLQHMMQNGVTGQQVGT